VDKIEYIINDLYDGKNTVSLAIRKGLFEPITDYFFIKKVIWRSDGALGINAVNGETMPIEPNQWVYAFKMGKRVIVVTKPLPFNRSAEEASHRLRVKHNNFNIKH